MLIHWLWYALLPEISTRQKVALLEHYSDPEDIYKLHSCTNISGLTEKQKTALMNKDLRQAEKLEHICARKDIGILTFDDPRYPERLRNIDTPPLVLYYKGTLPDFGRSLTIGVVGTRTASAYGLNAARQFGRQIASGGAIVVSGGAKGIDTMALRGALEAGGTVVAVLGNGVDVTYPVINRRLFMEIATNGCLLSEYVPGDGPERWHFPERNRIISGLSNGTLVVEAPERSGALITARDALEQGRDVFVVPGNIDTPTCQGSNALLRDGAAAVFSGEQILQEYASQYGDTIQYSRQQKPEMKAAQPVILPQNDRKDIDKCQSVAYSGVDNQSAALTEEEEKILACLDTMPKPVDDVIAQSGLPAGRVLSVLTKLALKGVLVNHPGRLVSARKQ